MSNHLPRAAAPIQTRLDVPGGGGLFAVAHTDPQCRGYMTLCGINRSGQRGGLTMLKPSFSSDLVLGFDQGLPVIVHATVEVTPLGVHIVCDQPWAPVVVQHKRLQFKQSFAPWAKFTGGQHDSTG